jgi:hypothetical protein
MTQRWGLHRFCLFVRRWLVGRRDGDSFSTCKALEQTIGQHSHGRIRGAGRLSLAWLCRGCLLRHQGCSAGPGREAGQEHDSASNRRTARFLGLRRRPYHRCSRRNVMSPLAIIALPAHSCRPVSFTGGPFQLARNGSIEAGLSGLSDGGRMREPVRWS